MIHELLQSADPEQSPEELAFDSPYLEQFRGSLDQQDYAAIAQLCEELAPQGIYDVRLLLSAIYEETRPDPLASLPGVFESLLSLLNEFWPLVTPLEKKVKYAKGSLTWLFKQILADLQVQQVDNSALLSEWLAGSFSRENADHVLMQISQLSRLIDSTYEEMSGGTTQALNDLSSWIKTLQPQLQTEYTPSEEDLSEGELVEPEQTSSKPKPSSQGSRSFEGVEGSYHLTVLMQKMALLKQMTEEGNLLKVAILASDINGTIEQFDPKKYFPQLFAEYLYLMVNQANQINEALEMRDSPQWIVLSELLQVDLEKFSEISIEY